MLVPKNRLVHDIHYRGIPILIESISFDVEFWIKIESRKVMSVWSAEILVKMVLQNKKEFDNDLKYRRGM